MTIRNGRRRPDGHSWSVKRLARGVAAVGLVMSAVGVQPRASASAATDWWSGVQRDLAAYEYLPSASETGVQAPNRAHNLRTYFDASGIRVHDRTADGSAELLSLSLAAMGRRESVDPLTAGALHQVGSRVEIRRPTVIEWYENSAQGLEQGFTVPARPAGDGPLVLELTVRRARARLRGDAIELTTDAGRTLRYGKLLAEDSRGRVLASRLEVPSSERVQLIVDDAAAAYPLLIDPLLTGVPDQRLESNQSDPEGHGTPEFGFSVSSAGDVNGDGFDDVIVGAPGWDGGQQGEGAAFVFLGSASGIVGSDPSTAQAHIESNQPLAAFGVSVSGAGDVNHDGYDDVIVGANFYRSTLPGTQLAVEGAAFVFLGSASGVQGRDPATAHASIFSDDNEAEFGEVVAGAGDVNGDGFDDVIVSAPHQGHPFPPGTGIPPNEKSGEHGAAFVLHGSAQGVASGTAMITADAVLLPYELGPADPVVLAQFSSVAGAGDVNGDGFDDILVSGDDAFLFIGSPAGVVGRDPTTAQSRVRRDDLTAGFKVAGAGDVNGDGFDDILLGAPGRESVRFSSDQTGAAFVFLGGAGGIVGGHVADAHAAVFGSILAEWVGHSVDAAGDVDRDGFADIVVAARVYPGSLPNEGVAYLFRGSAQGITARSLLDADARLEARQSGAVVKGTSAFSVSGAGDINGDRFADVIMGKGFYDAGQQDEGAAFIYLGGPRAGNPNQPPTAVAGDDQLVFDTNADGFESITVDGTASFDTDGFIASYAWFEGGTLLGTTPVLTTSLSTTGDHTLALTVTDDDGVSRSDPVIVRVEQVEDVRVLTDTFAAGFGAWARGGDVVLSSADAFPTAPQVRLGASGAFLRRSIAMPAGSTGMVLDLWGKATGFAAADQLLIKVSVDGGPFTVIRAITSVDSNNTYVFYGGSAIPLGHSWFPATASSIVLEFESRMTTGRFFLDDVKVDALLAPTGGPGPPHAPIANAGADRILADSDGSGAETVTMDGSGSSDADGTIVSYAWREGTTLLGTSATLTVALGVGEHTLTLTVTDNDKQTASDTAVVAVAVNQPPVALAGADKVVTDSDRNGGEQVTVSGAESSDSDGSLARVEWREGTTLLGTSAVLTTTLAVGIHTLTLSVTDNGGAIDTDTVVVTVNPGEAQQPGQGVVTLTGPSSVRRGDRASFTVTLRNTGTIALTNVQLTFAVSPSNRFRSISPGNSVSVGTLAAGASVSRTWTARGDREGSATVTAKAASGGVSIGTATLSVMVRR
jgi:uncharacterized repeat protein (TIGR01451 family)